MPQPDPKDESSSRPRPAWMRSLRRHLVDRSGAPVPPHTWGLPGVPDGPPAPPRVPGWVTLLVVVLLLVAAAVLAVLRAPALVWLVLAVVAVLAIAGTQEGPLRYARHRRRVRRALRSYGPTIAMAYAGRSGGPWQLRMWEPPLLASGEPCVIVNLHDKYRPMILDGPVPLRSPFVQLGDRGFDDLPDVMVPSLTSLWYVQNARSNQRYQAYDRLTHVWLNHGDSDKPANFNPRHASYDVLVVCGEAGIDRYAKHGIDIPREKFEIVGRPQAAGIAPARGPVRDLEDATLFYAPTWQGVDPSVNFSSLELGPQIVEAAIARGLRVIFRPHPLSYRWRIRRAVIREIRLLLKADKQAGGPDHVWGETADKTWTIKDCVNRSDLLISDVSSVVSDWLQSEKPYAMMNMRDTPEGFRAENAVAQTAYVIGPDLAELEETLDLMTGDDPLAQARAERKRYVLGDFTGDESAEAFAEFVRRVVREGR